MDWVGRSTVLDDSDLLWERLPKMLDWVLNTPWPVPAALAGILTLATIWINRPQIRRGVKVITLEDAKRLGLEESDLEGKVVHPPHELSRSFSMKLLFPEGRKIPELISSKNLYRYYWLGLALPHRKENNPDEIVVSGINSLFIVYDKPISDPNIRVRISEKNCHYEVKDSTHRHCVIVIGDIPKGTILEIETY